MKVYRILVPTKTNQGESYRYANEAFEQFILREAGGFTKQPLASGQWRDDNGVVYRDQVIPYDVGTNAKTYVKLVDEALRLFSDQEAIFAMELGQGTIFNRPAKAA